jgi:HAD superfamily hydrolase (TIGR01548 family)
VALPQPSPNIVGIVPYKVPRHGAPMDLLLDGIGGLPSPVDLFRGLDDADPELLVRAYPSSDKLAAALAAKVGVTPDRLIVTSGGDDALDRACRSLLAPGRSIVLPVPTFEMIERYSRWTGATLRHVDWSHGDYPVDAVIAAADETTTAVAVVSPNNPTGAVISASELRRLSAALPHAVLLVDLAYVEFADEDLTSVVVTLPNAVGFRTMSKAYGLAGLRVGYAFGVAEVIGWMRAAGNPYTVSGPSIHLALKRLVDAHEVVHAYIDRVRAQRDGLADLLAGLGAKPMRSQANFVFSRTDKADWIRDGLAGLGIGVRTWPGHPMLGDAVRINVPGEDAVLERLTHALQTVLAPQAVLLDMDGVIADTSASYRESIVRTCAQFGVTITHTDIAEVKAKGNANNDWVVTQRILAANGIDVPLDEVTRRFEDLYQGVDGVPGLKTTERLLFPRAAFEALSKRYPIAIVTGRPTKDAHEFLELHDLKPFIQVVVCMEDGPCKPDPFPVREALRQLGLTRAWMVGDTPDDVRASRAAGVVPLGVPSPGEDVARATDTLTASGAARVLPDITHLPELLP